MNNCDDMNIVISNLKYYMNLKPDFIKETEKHKTIWSLIKTCNSYLRKLINENILDDNEIKDITRFFENYLNNAFTLTSKNMELLVGNYYLELFEYMMVLCLNYELYETCENIKIFSEKYIGVE